jgi:hypothetical protein
MKASDYVAQQLLSENEPYGARYQSQPRVLTSIRLPVELIAWLEVLKTKGLGDSRSAVVQVLLDVAIEQVTTLGVCGDGSDLSDMVDAVKDQLELKLTEGGVE